MWEKHSPPKLVQKNTSWLEARRLFTFILFLCSDMNVDLSIYFCKNEFIFALIGPSKESRSEKKESCPRAGYQGSKQAVSQTRPLVGRVDNRTLIWRQMYNHSHWRPFLWEPKVQASRGSASRHLFSMQFWCLNL